MKRSKWMKGLLKAENELRSGGKFIDPDIGRDILSRQFRSGINDFFKNYRFRNGNK